MFLAQWYPITTVSLILGFYIKLAKNQENYMSHEYLNLCPETKHL